MLTFNKKHIPSVLALVFVLSIQATLNAQQAVVNATLNKETITIGQQATLTLTAKPTGTVHLVFPKIKDTLVAGLEVIQQSKIDSSHHNGRLLLSQKITITAFDSGTYHIPALPFLAFAENQKDSLHTQPIDVQVNTIQVDTTKNFKDIAAPYEAPMTFKEFMQTYGYWILAGLLAVAGMSYLIYYLRKKRNQKGTPPIPKKTAPPHVVAMRALQALKEEKHWQNGRIKQYYTQLTDILREYIEERYHIQTWEKTSSEILSQCNTYIDDNHTELLTYIFQLADMAKFAKSQPLPDENDTAFKKAVDFVENTQQKVEPENKKKA